MEFEYNISEHTGASHAKFILVQYGVAAGIARVTETNMNPHDLLLVDDVDALLTSLDAAAQNNWSNSKPTKHATF